jgi:hypothetical protein
MGLSQVHSGSGHEGNLSGGIDGHSPDGVFGSLKGMALEAPELSFYDQDGNIGPDRLNQEQATTNWLATGPIMNGSFDPDALTRGTDKHMPK